MDRQITAADRHRTDDHGHRFGITSSAVTNAGFVADGDIRHIIERSQHS
jgi:hypothetical protein